MQDRVHHLQEVLDPISLPIHQNVLNCRSHGQSKLCDGFVCLSGADCQSGCCASFSGVKEDYCQPLIDDVCPVAGFKYGPHGDIHEEPEELEEIIPVETESLDELDNIPTPPQFNEDGTGEKPPLD